MINVRWYKTATDRKQDKVFAEFLTKVEPAAVTPVNTELTGKALTKDQERFLNETEKARLDAEFKALDTVREAIGYSGVLVAYEVKDDETGGTNDGRL